jgi:2-polyprenyl-6-methoxyphenol hydroxylase-like FAD-dependent oxidoreductase
MPISSDMLYMFATVRESRDSWYERESWPHEMRARFNEFEGPARQFLAELGDNSEVLYTAVEEVTTPLPWHAGRAVLIGDAAHASTPFMGQGGAMAVQDAVVLAEMLSLPGAVSETLRAFGQQRYPACKFVQDASRRVGEAGATEDPESCVSRNSGMRETAQQHVDSFYRELYAMQERLAPQ